MTPAQALIMISRTNTDGTPETSAQICEIFRALFSRDDADLRKSLSVQSQGFTEILEYTSLDLGIN